MGKGLGLGTTTHIGERSSSSLLYGLIAWYTGENQNDSHSSNLHLTPQNAPTYDEVGVIGNAFNPGTDAGGRHWTHPDGFIFAPGRDSWTFACHIKPRSVATGYQGLMSIGTAGNPYIWIRSRPDLASIWINVHDGTNSKTETKATISNDVYSSLIIVLNREDQTLRSYVNNVEIGTRIDTSTIGDIIPDGEMRLAKSINDHVTDSPLDEVAFWSKALTKSERTLYNTGITYSNLTQ